MHPSVFWQTLRETRRPLMYWSLSLAGAAWLILLFHLFFRLITGDEAGMVSPPAWLAFVLVGADSLAGAGEWLRAAGFGLILPLGLIVFTVFTGSWLVAGEEERSMLGLLLATPLRRRRLIFEKYAVLVLLALIPAAGIWLTLSLACWAGWLPMSWAALTKASAVLFLMGLAFGALAMALGCLTGKRWLSFGVMLFYALLALLVSRLPGSFPAQPVLRFVSPFYYYDSALLSYLYGVHAFVLALFAAAGLILAWAAFENRDLPA